MSAAACSACYGSGYGVDEKPCPCGCRPAPVPAIAPPVAAGSVDTAEFREVLNAAVMCKSSMQIQCNARLLDLLDAWGAQQREAGRQSEAAHILHLTHERDLALASTRAYAERAAKAEARVKDLQAELDIELERAYDRLLAARTNKQAARQVLQADGRHPAPCARDCEANAFQIEVRRLQAVELNMHRKLAAEKLRADQGWARYEAAMGRAPGAR